MSNKKKESMAGIYGTTRVGERGQIVIPKKLREKMKMKAGDEFVVMRKEEAIVLVPTKIMMNMMSEMTKQFKKIKH